MVVAKSGVRKVEVAMRDADGADIFFIFEILFCLKKSSSGINISGYGLIGRDVIGEIGSVIQLVNRSVKIFIFREELITIQYCSSCRRSIVLRVSQCSIEYSPC